MSQKRVLVIGASDGCGRTGIEADQKIIAAHGCYASTATTALRTPITKKDSELYIPPAAFVKKAIDTCFDDGGVEVMKIGFLAHAEGVQTVVDALKKHGPRFVVVDPVIASASDMQALSDEALQIFRTQLLPLTTVLTLRLPEAVLLVNNAAISYQPYLHNLDDLTRLAKALHSFGPLHVLLRGAQLRLTESLEVQPYGNAKEKIVDVYYNGTDVSLIERTYVDAGTLQVADYTLVPALASNLALGHAVPSAIQKACRYVEAGISKGSGGIDYFHSTYTLPFSAGHFIEYLLNREDVKLAWHAHVHHDFVKRIGDGTLPIEKFKYYLVQDYLFLVQFARAKALGAYKSKSMEEIAAAAEEILHIKREMSLHLDYCAEFGLSKKEVEEREEHQACTAYTRYVLDIAHSESWFALQMAFAPCLLGYGIIAKRLYDNPITVREPGNKYWKWIQNYVADDYRAAVEAGEAMLEKHAVLQSPSQLESLVKIFVHATKMETGFWDMGNR